MPSVMEQIELLRRRAARDQVTAKLAAPSPAAGYVAGSEPVMKSATDEHVERDGKE